MPALASVESQRETVQTSNDTTSAACVTSTRSNLSPFATAFVPQTTVTAPASALSPLATPFEPLSAFVALPRSLSPIAAPFEPASPFGRIRSTLNPFAGDFRPLFANSAVDASDVIESASTIDELGQQATITTTLNAEAADFVPSIFGSAGNAIDELPTTPSESALQPDAESDVGLETEETALALVSNQDESVWESSDDQDAFHHRNFFGDMVYRRSQTPPSTSLAIIMSKPKLMFSTRAFDVKLHLSILLKNACVWLDPVVYWGSLPILRNARGSTLQMSVTGVCGKFYSHQGSWQTDSLNEDEDKPYPDDCDYHPENAILNGWFDNHAVPSVTKIFAVSNEVFDEAYPDFGCPHAFVQRKNNRLARGGSRLCQVTDITDSGVVAADSIRSSPTVPTSTHVSTFAQQLEDLAPLGASGDWADDDDEEDTAPFIQEAVSILADEVETPPELCMALVKWTPPVSWTAPCGTPSSKAAPPSRTTSMISGDHPASLAPAPASTTKIEPVDLQASEPVAPEPSRAMVKWQSSQSTELAKRPVEMSNAEHDLRFSAACRRTEVLLAECHKRLDNVQMGHEVLRKQHPEIRSQVGRITRRRAPRRVLGESVKPIARTSSKEDDTLEAIEAAKAQWPTPAQVARGHRRAYGISDSPRVAGMTRSPGIHGNAYGGKGLRGYLLAQRAERAAQQAVPEPRSPFAPITNDLAPAEQECVSMTETPEVVEEVEVAQPKRQQTAIIKKVAFAPIDTEHRFFTHDPPSLAYTDELQSPYDPTNRHLDEPIIESDGAELIPRSLSQRRLWGDVHPLGLPKSATVASNNEDDTDSQDASETEQQTPSLEIDTFVRPSAPTPYSVHQGRVLKSYGDLSESLNIAPEVRPENCRPRECSVASLMSEIDEAIADNRMSALSDLYASVEDLLDAQNSNEHESDSNEEQQEPSQELIEDTVEQDLSLHYPTQLEAIEEEANVPELTSDEDSDNPSSTLPPTPLFQTEFESFPQFDSHKLRSKLKGRSFRRASWDRVTQLITKKRSPTTSTTNVYTIVMDNGEPCPLPAEKKSSTKRLFKGMKKGVKKIFGKEMNVLR